ncbi:MAG TPA: RluA family pseudouridine synthase [Planctomycetota bacterium]|nr:RluA family pseudouridine synthase [Planctomycetota bacterium]
MDVTASDHEKLQVEADEAGERLDSFLARRDGRFSRNRFKALIKDGQVTVGERTLVEPNYRVNAGDDIAFTVPEPQESTPQPEAIPLNVVFEDADLIVVDKPAGLVVHPAAGNWTGTLVNALIAHCGDNLQGVGGVRRPGIVHRLDKDTTGVLVAAKNDQAHRHLSMQFERRVVAKEYHAVVSGEVAFDSDVIDRPLGRHAHDRTKMSVRADGKKSESFYETLERYPRFSWVRIAPKTGRTHQIRVHLASLGHPIASDRDYRGPVPTWRSLGVDPEDPGADLDSPVIDRPALHARRIEFYYPLSDRRIAFEAPLPPDFERLLRALRRAARLKTDA